jgi:hypothetical protein
MALAAVKTLAASRAAESMVFFMTNSFKKMENRLRKWTEGWVLYQPDTCPYNDASIHYAKLRQTTINNCF